MPVTKYVAQWRDSDSETATSGYYLDGNVTDIDGAAAEGMRAALQGLSDAPLVAHGLYPVNLTAYGTADAGDFATSKDKLLVEGQSSGGARLTIQIPSPKEAIFLSNAEHADPAHADVIALKAALEAVWKDSAGNAVSVIGMRRSKTK